MVPLTLSLLGLLVEAKTERLFPSLSDSTSQSSTLVFTLWDNRRGDTRNLLKNFAALYQEKGLCLSYHESPKDSKLKRELESLTLFDTSCKLGVLLEQHAAHRVWVLVLGVSGKSSLQSCVISKALDLTG